MDPLFKNPGSAPATDTKVTVYYHFLRHMYIHQQTHKLLYTTISSDTCTYTNRHKNYCILPFPQTHVHVYTNRHKSYCILPFPQTHVHTPTDTKVTVYYHFLRHMYIHQQTQKLLYTTISSDTCTYTNRHKSYCILPFPQTHVHTPTDTQVTVYYHFLRHMYMYTPTDTKITVYYHFLRHMCMYQQTQK